MGFGDFLAAGASALGVDTDDIGGLFDKAKGALGGDTDVGDLFGAAAQEFGIDTGDLTSAAGKVFGGGDAGDAADRIGQLFGGGGGATGSGGGFGGVVSDFFGSGDVGGAAQQAFGSFGSILSGGDGGQIAEYLPTAVKDALSEAGDLPFVQDAAGGDWAAMASSVPGLDGALGSFGLTTKDVAAHVEGMAGQAVGGGSAWSFGSALADRGSEFLQQVAAPMGADQVWSSLPGLAQRAGVELPSWAADMTPDGLVAQGGRYLQDGGFVPSFTGEGRPYDVWGADAPPAGQSPDPQPTDIRQPDDMTLSKPQVEVDDTTGESSVQPARDDGLDAFAESGAGQAEDMTTQDQFDTTEVEQPAVEQSVEVEAPPAQEEAPPPSQPEQFAASDQLEDDLGNLGDEAFS